MATGSTDREIKISVTVDANGAVKALTQLGDETKKAGEKVKESGKDFTKFQSTMIALNNGLDLVTKGFNLLSGAYNKVSSALERGDQFNSLTQNIRQLTSEAGKLTDVFEQKLFRAIDGNITNFDALKIAVGGLTLGLDQKTILEYAESADKLGDAVGISAADAFNTLINAVGKHKAGLLESLKISLDGIDINQRYADSIHKYAKDLTEQEKAEAQSVAAKELIRQKISQLADVSSGAGENLGKVSNAISNVTTAIFANLDSNRDLAKAFGDLFNALNGFDWDFWIINPISGTISAIANLGTNLKNVAAQVEAFGARFAFETQFNNFTKSVSAATKAGLTLNDAVKANEVSAKALVLNYGNASEILQKRYAPFLKEIIKALNSETVALKKTTEEVKKGAKGHKDYGDTNSAVNKTLSEQIDLLNKASADVEKLDKALQAGLISPQQFDEAIKKIQDDLKKMGFTGEQATNTITKGLDAGTDSIGEFQEKAKEGAFLDEIAAQANQISGIIDGISGIGGIIGGVEADELAGVVQGVATAIGAAIGAYYGNVAGGAAAGSAIGGILGQFAEPISNFLGLSDSKASKERKKLDAYLDDIFNVNRISVLIDGKLRRLRELADGGGLFGSPASNFYDQFNQLEGAAKDAFRAVGVAFGQLAGVSASIGSTFGAVFANNIGPSLNNLQLLVEASGHSFEELGTQIEKAFLNGELSITQARLALIGLEKTAQKGIPDAVGAADTAFQNLIDAGLNGGRASVDALKDIVYEAKELGITNFAELRKFIRESGDFSGKEIKALFGALKDIGVSNFDQLTSASLSTIIAVLTQFNSRGGFDEATAKLEDTATAINNVPAEKKVKFIIDVDYTDRAKSTTAQAALANINAPTVKRAEGVR